MKYLIKFDNGNSKISTSRDARRHSMQEKSACRVYRYSDKRLVSATIYDKNAGFYRLAR